MPVNKKNMDTPCFYNGREKEPQQTPYANSGGNCDRACDASVLVSALWMADVNHAISRTWLDTQLELGTPIVAPWLLLAEIAGAVTRRTSDDDLGFDAAEYVQALPTLVLIDFNALLGQRSIEANYPNPV